VFSGDFIHDRLGRRLVFLTKPRDAPIVRFDRVAKSACRMLAATLARRASPIYDVRHVGLQRRREAGIVRRLVCGSLFRR
jgi:regulator of extracellular matrix RemA (YlzA/DUF370 family)